MKKEQAIESKALSEGRVGIMDLKKSQDRTENNKREASREKNERALKQKVEIYEKSIKALKASLEKYEKQEK